MEKSSTQNSVQSPRFMLLPGQVRGVVFLALETVVIWKCRSNSERPAQASVQMTDYSPTVEQFPHTGQQTFSPSSSCLPRHGLMKPSQKMVDMLWVGFCKVDTWETDWQKKNYSEWVFIFSCAANPLWSGKPPETFWSNSWLEGASLKTEPFRSFRL